MFYRELDIAVQVGPVLVRLLKGNSPIFPNNSRTQLVTAIWKVEVFEVFYRELDIDVQVVAGEIAGWYSWKVIQQIFQVIAAPN